MSVRRHFQVLLAPCLLVLVGCIGEYAGGIAGSGISKTETRQVDEFRSIRHDTVGNVTVRIGQTQEVKITFDDNLLSIVDTSVVDGELRIKTTDSFNSKVGLNIQVTVPEIDELKLTGVGSLLASGIEAESLRLQQSGVGTLKVEGKAKSVSLKASGVGNANLRGLEAENATVVVSGVGGVTVFASESIDAQLSGVGGVKVHGDPKERKIKSGGIGKVTFE